ncbi:hypothetical protein DIPPA_14013 [Diplonema papillatum]|nr:hypothetical protein DIPPA_14013 [Diplonema papillatum]
MFSQSERILLKDANRQRFSNPEARLCPGMGATPITPGPSYYVPVLPRQTTKRHLFPREPRRPLNGGELAKNYPGPGWYEAAAGFAEQARCASPQARHKEKKVKEGIAGEEGDRASRAFADKSERLKSVQMATLANQCFEHVQPEEGQKKKDKKSGKREDSLTGIVPGGAGIPPFDSNSHSAAKQSLSGPASKLPSADGGGQHVQSSVYGGSGSCDFANTTSSALWRARGGKPASHFANLNLSGRNLGQNLDGRSFDSIRCSPAPGTYTAVVACTVKGGTFPRVPRDKALVAMSEVPGPGTYSSSSVVTRLPIQFPATPRNLGRIVCGTDLKLQRRLPGPASYYPYSETTV